MNQKLYLLIIVTLIISTQSCTKPTIVDARDGEVYKTVTINEQTWFAENARYNVSGSVANPAYPSKEYGRLYTWDQAMEACPEGWHLPTDQEWNELELSFGMEKKDTNVHLTWRGNQGKFMKATSGWKFLENGKDNRGFKVLPAGVYEEGRHQKLWEVAEFWTASKTSNALNATVNQYWYRHFSNLSSGVQRSRGPHVNGKSCRCLKNK